MVTSTKISNLFDKLSQEIYYRINFKINLMDCNEDFIDTLEKFVDECKRSRNQIS